MRKLGNIKSMMVAECLLFHLVSKEGNSIRELELRHGMACTLASCSDSCWNGLFQFQRTNLEPSQPWLLLSLPNYELKDQPSAPIKACPWDFLCSSMVKISPSSAKVRSLVGELRFHMFRGQKTKTWNRGNIVTNSIKTLFFFKFYFIFKLYIIVLVLPNIKMNPPQDFKNGSH